jgi:DNA invertase Pin-like site-specific DNA recombinase
LDRKFTRSTPPRTVSYLRVSTSQQDTEKNKLDVMAFANAHDFGRVEFIEEKVSGRVPWKERRVKQLIDSLKSGDRLIVPELSRLGRSTLEIMEMLSVAKEKGVAIYDVKNKWELNSSLQAEVMAFCFSIAARIERDLLIQRTGEGRRAAMERGVKFGRPPGKGKSKLDSHKDEIIALLKTGSRQTYIAKRYGCTPATLNHWLKKNEIDVKKVEEC